MSNSTAGGQSGIRYQGSLDASAIQDIQDSLAQGQATVLTGTVDAVPFPGIIKLNGGSADAATLAAPIAGPQPVGDDGKTVTIVDTSGKAHTVTTPTNKIINSKRILTWNGTIGSNITLAAIGGVWVPIGTPNGVTIT
jgi:hypothetical protein